jgi:hypothetical protein
MIAEAWKDEIVWCKNTRGDCPTGGSDLVDVIWTSGLQEDGEVAGELEWHLSKNISACDEDILLWRLHTPLDTILPAPTMAMPYVKPAKQENVFVEVNPATQSKVVQAFNRMTGHNITDDDLNTIKILNELFGSK